MISEHLNLLKPTSNRLPQVLDGNAVVSQLCYALSDAIFTYPITPSTNVCERVHYLKSLNVPNYSLTLSPHVQQMESEMGVAGAMHGSALAGLLPSTATCSQGLMLMIPNILKMSGERLPSVFHVTARSVATHSTSIHGDHSDVMLLRDLGCIMISSSNPQECLINGIASYAIAKRCRLPVIHFYDGFKTSHEMSTVLGIENPNAFEKYIEEINEKKMTKSELVPMLNSKPRIYGPIANPETSFQMTVAQRALNIKDNIPKIVSEEIERVRKLILNCNEDGRNKKSINEKHSVKISAKNNDKLYRVKNAIICMGSVSDTIEEVIKKIDNEENAVIKINLFRPFPVADLSNVILEKFPNLENITVLDNVYDVVSAKKESDQPLYLDVVNTVQIMNRNLEDNEKRKINIYHGTYGIGGHDFTEKDALSVIANPFTVKKTDFVVGIIDDVLKSNLPEIKLKNNTNQIKKYETSIKIYGTGADGTVSSSRSLLTAVNNFFNSSHVNTTKGKIMYSQASFQYDAKKSGGQTITNIRFSNGKPITYHCPIDKASTIAVMSNSVGILTKLGRQIANELENNSTLIINTDCNPAETKTIWEQFYKKGVPASILLELRNKIKEKNVKFMVVNASKIAKDSGLSYNQINYIMQIVIGSSSELSCLEDFNNIHDRDPTTFMKKELDDALQKYIEGKAQSCNINKGNFNSFFYTYLEDNIKTIFKKKGQEIIDRNIKAIHKLKNNWDQYVIEVPEQKIDNLLTKNIYDDIITELVNLNAFNVSKAYNNESDLYYIENVSNPIKNGTGNKIPVSVMEKILNDGFPTSTTNIEKRGIGDAIPEWIPEKCIQCGLCQLSCPHAAIRAYMSCGDEAKSELKEKFDIDSIQVKNKKIIKAVFKDVKSQDKRVNYTIQCSPDDCTGCNICAIECPTKALSMKSEKVVKEKEKEKYNVLNNKKDALVDDTNILDDIAFTVRGAGIRKPMIEFHGACSGCGESPYIELLSKLYQDDLVIAEATGCPLVYLASVGSAPFPKDKNGRGIAWANSLFEDNAQFGLGIIRGYEYKKAIAIDAANKIIMKLNKNIEGNNQKLINILNDWLNEEKEIFQNNKYKNAKLEMNKNLKKTSNELKLILDSTEYIISKDVRNEINEKILPYITHPVTFILGGDGWAYDIGYAGLDYIVASGQNVNVMILDTSGYSNTGGQKSGSSPVGSIMKMADEGVPKTSEKDLAKIFAEGYRDKAYVASISLAANPEQALKSIREAVEFNGPSIIVAYSPCLSHGIKGGLKNSAEHQKLFVQSGMWNLFRSNPEKKEVIIDNVDDIEKYYEDNHEVIENDKLIKDKMRKKLNELLNTESRFRKVANNKQWIDERLNYNMRRLNRLIDFKKSVDRERERDNNSEKLKY